MLLAVLLALTLSDPAGKLPNHKLSPGEVVSRDTAVVCHTGTALERRKETKAIKDSTYALYGVKPDGTYVVDHVIPLELGGKSSVKNSFPQKKIYSVQKDSLENKLHSLVCKGKYSLPRAQSRIAANWYRLWLEVKRVK